MAQVVYPEFYKLQENIRQRTRGLDVESSRASQNSKHDSQHHEDRVRWLEELREGRSDSGVRQGDSLSPLRFKFVLHFVARKLELAGDRLEWTTRRRLRDFAYTHKQIIKKT